MTRLAPALTIVFMVQARDELFLKLAHRQGLFSEQEARDFLNRYRDEGATGEGIGHWLFVEGVLSEEQAEMIRSAIAHRAQGHVDNTRRRVPISRAKGGGHVAQAHAHHGPHGTHAHHRHHHPHGKQVTPAQKTLFIGSGIVAVGLLVFLVMEFQKAPPRIESTPEVSTVTPTNESAQEAVDRLAGADAPTSLTGKIATPKWTPEEIESMKGRVTEAVTLARGHMGDGRPGRGIATIQKRAAELGTILPPEVQSLVDAEIGELQKVVDETYTDALAELRTAKASGDEGAIEKAYFTIEEACGAEYVEKAKKAIE